jgi:hypothetical protein
MKPFRMTILFAIGLFVFDAFVLNQGFVALLVILLVTFVFIPRALWTLPPFGRRFYHMETGGWGFLD